MYNAALISLAILFGFLNIWLGLSENLLSKRYRRTHGAVWPLIFIESLQWYPWTVH